jgi:hypothetical protein
MKNFIFIFIICTSIFANDFEKSTNIVIDKTSNIMWQDNQESTQHLEDITMAKTYCENLILNGYIDWKMATIEQLQSIIDITNKEIAVKKEFQYTSASKYWSMSNNIINTNQFWYVDFKTGIVNFSTKNDKYTVRCIRDIK